MASLTSVGAEAALSLAERRSRRDRSACPSPKTTWGRDGLRAQRSSSRDAAACVAGAADRLQSRSPRPQFSPPPRSAGRGRGRGPTAAAPPHLSPPQRLPAVREGGLRALVAAISIARPIPRRRWRRRHNPPRFPRPLTVLPPFGAR